MKIRCIGLPGPEGNYVATSQGLIPYGPTAAEALARDGMLLSLDPDHAERLQERHAAVRPERPAA